jgi:hypothetical protein
MGVNKDSIALRVWAETDICWLWFNHGVFIYWFNCLPTPTPIGSAIPTPPPMASQSAAIDIT